MSMLTAGPSRRSSIPPVPDALWSPLVAGLVTLVPGLVGLATGQILLFPSLGPTAVIQAHDPEQPSARFYNVLASHLGGLASAYLAVTLLGIAHAPSVFEARQLSVARVVAAALAIILAIGVEKLLRAYHPPAASTTLLAALGSFKPTLQDALSVVIGVLIVAGVGEGFRRLRLRSTAIAGKHQKEENP